MEKMDPEELPTIEYVSNIIESILRSVFRENFHKYVIRQEKRRFIVLPPRYLHFPPILITIQSHPEREDRALFITISRRIPIDSTEDVKRILANLDGLMHIEIEEIERAYNSGKDKDRLKMNYLLLSYRMHALSIQDKAWLLLAFSSAIRLDEKFMVEKERVSRKEERVAPSAEYT